MATVRLGGSGVGLNLTNAVGGPLPQNVTSPVTAFNPSRGSNAITLTASECMLIPAGTFWIATGPYTSLQFKDPVTGTWRTICAESGLFPQPLDSDGANFRIANLTGCAIGALITNASSGMTNGIGSTATGLTVTASAGASVWQPVVGGAINSTIAITAGGSGYLYPPILVIDAPPVGGIQATATCTISAGAINAVTVLNQGAGYTNAPNVTVLNDPRDNAGLGGVLTVNATLVGSGALTALYPTNHGTAVTSVPTFTFTASAGGSGLAATMIMNFAVTGFTIGSGLSGAAYGTSQPFLIEAIGGDIAASSRASNTAGPIADINLTQPRIAVITGTSTSGGKIQTSGAVIVDSGFGFQAVPGAYVFPGGATVPTTLATPTISVGGVTDTSWIQPV